METNTDKLILNELSDLKDLLGAMGKHQQEFEVRMELAMSSTNEKLKSNQLLLDQRITSYVTKDSCESLRSRQGERLGGLTDEVQELKTKLSLSMKLVAFVVGIIGVPTLLGIVYMIMLYQQVQSIL